MARISVEVSILESPRWTGVERGAAGLVRALGAIPGADEVHLYSRRPVDWPFPLTDRLAPRPIGGPRHTALWRELALAPRLARDGIAAHFSPVAALPLLTRVPRVATVHEMPWLRHPGIEGRFREAIYRARIRTAARVAAHIVVPSETVAADLLGLAPWAAGRVSVLPFGIEETFRPIADDGWRAIERRRLGVEDGPLVLFVGKPRRRKNLPVLFDALARLRDVMRPAPSLLLAGVTASEVARAPGVHPLGHVTDEVLVRLYNLAAVLAVPSLSEGFGFPPLEAMACGTPVVAARAGSLPEVVRNAAMLVDPTSARELSDALRATIEDGALRSRLSRRGHDRARDFTWTATGLLAASVLRSVAA